MQSWKSRIKLTHWANELEFGKLIMVINPDKLCRYLVYCYLKVVLRNQLSLKLGRSMKLPKRKIDGTNTVYLSVLITDVSLFGSRVYQISNPSTPRLLCWIMWIISILCCRDLITCSVINLNWERYYLEK